MVDIIFLRITTTTTTTTTHDSYSRIEIIEQKPEPNEPLKGMDVDVKNVNMAGTISYDHPSLYMPALHAIYVNI